MEIRQQKDTAYPLKLIIPTIVHLHCSPIILFSNPNTFIVYLLFIFDAYIYHIYFVGIYGAHNMFFIVA